MKNIFFNLPCLIALNCFFGQGVYAEKDPGKEVVARLLVQVYFATNDEVPDLGERAQMLSSKRKKELRKQEHLRFKHYRKIGEDEQPVWRSYQNWAMPLKPSKEIMISYEPTGGSTNESLQLDLDYWQSNRKVAKFSPTLRKEGNYYILGPVWKNGRLILAISSSNINFK